MKEEEREREREREREGGGREWAANPKSPFSSQAKIDLSSFECCKKSN